jgi:acyl-CoA-binding protein
LDGRISEEERTGKKVNYSFLKTFSCEAFVHIDKENRTNIESKSEYRDQLQGKKQEEEKQEYIVLDEITEK